MRIALVGAEMEENLAVRYIRGALEQAGHEVVQIVFNSDAEQERAARELAGSGAELAGFSMVFTYRALEFAALARRARALGYAGHLVAGGHFAAFNAEALLRDEPAFDSVGIGEGELLMCDLAGSLGDPAAVRGLVWRNGAGRIVRNTAAVKPPDLDALPYPPHRQPPDTYLGLPIANLLSSRGCTHACAFCSIAAWHRFCGGARFRLRAPERVADEMAGLYHQGYRLFNFHDDNFFLGDSGATVGRMKTLRRELDRRAVGRIGFAVKSRPDSVERDLFAFLKEQGLFRVFLGIEAGTPEALRRLGRRQTVETNERALEILNRLDIHTCYNLLLLNPHSTLDDFRANVDFLRRHPANPMNFCRTEIYAGTPLEQELRRAGRLLGSYWGYRYRIGDERAQLAFELMNEGLFERHHTVENVHHLTMRVDYERQLLAHFFAPSGRLRRRAKDFVARVNTNSAEYLDEIADAAGRGFLSRARREEYLAGLFARVRKDNRALEVEGERILAAIRQAAWRARGKEDRSWQRTAAAVGLVATLTLAGADTSLAQVQPQVFEMIALPNPVDTRDAGAIKAQIQREILPRVAASLDKATNIMIVVKIGAQGSAEECRVYEGTAEGGSTGRQLASPDVKDVVFKQTGVKPGERSVFFAALQVEAARRKPADPEEGSSVLIEADFDAAALAYLAERIDPAQDVEVELWLDGKGAVTYAGVYKPMPSRGTTGEIGDADTKRAAGLLKDLGSGKAATRRKATEELQKLGRPVLPLVRKTMAATDDPEVAERCREIIGGLEQALDVPRIGEVIKFLQTLTFAGKDVAGKRFFVPVPRRELELAGRRQPWRRGTMMFEMAPMAND